jgi:imidazolonepropionase-like amidohydrolase
MPVRIVVAGQQAEIFIIDMATPALFIPELKRELQAGKVGVHASGFAEARFSNFRISTDPPPPFRGKAATPVAAGPGTIMSWSVSNAFDEKLLEEKIRLTDQDRKSLAWTRLDSEASGVANLARIQGPAEGRNTAFARVIIESPEDQVKRLEFGFSDRVRVYLNDRLIYSGNNNYRSRDYRFLGTIGLFDALNLPLKKGTNEIWFAVSESFGGWGIVARIEDAGGITSGIPATVAVDETGADVVAAAALFEANLDAIRQKDREAYLATYLNADTLARTGPEGIALGFDSHAAQAGDGEWPDHFEGLDLTLVPVRPGFVYGTYRYRVRYGDDEQSGISERLFIRTDGGWKIAMTSAFPAPPGTPPPPRALIGGTLVDGTGAPPIPDSVVVLRSGAIDCAGTRAQCPLPDGVDIQDVTGLWITPGLIDAHVHFSQTGWADGRPDAVDVRDLYPYDEVQAGLRRQPERWFRSYLCSGVTAVFDVGGYPWTWGLRDRAEADPFAPRVAAAGPLLSTLDFWLNLPGERQFMYIGDEDAVRDGIDYHAAHGTSAVKVWFIAPGDLEPEEREALVLLAGKKARDHGLPLIVHATGLQEARVAVRAGARLLVHSVHDQPVDDDFLRLARGQGTIYCPTLIVSGGYARLWESILSGEEPVIDDPNGCVDAETRARVTRSATLGPDRIDRDRVTRGIARIRERESIKAENLKRIHAAGIPIAMGTDAGNPLTLHGPSVFAEMEAMERAGMSPADVLIAATRTAALAMGRGDDLGTIEPGKAADLLIVGADPMESIANLRRTRFVIRGGVVRSIEELRPSLP